MARADAPAGDNDYCNRQEMFSGKETSNFIVLALRSRRPSRLNFKGKLGSKEADVVLLKEVHLSQHDRRGIGSSPGKSQTYRCERCYVSYDKQTACFDFSQITAQLQRCFLIIPDCT